jgi:hypothetical protein
VRRSWLLLILLVLCAAAGIVTVCQRDRVSNLPTTPPAPAAPSGAGEAAPASGDLAGSRPVRDGAPAATPPDDRIAALEVLVLRSPDPASGGPATPVAEVEVTALVDGDSGRAPRRLVGTSDPAGWVRFAIPGGAGRPFVVGCLGASPAQGTLQADLPTVRELQLATRVRVRGSVVDAAGRGVAAADLVLLPWLDRYSHPPRPRRVGQSAADGSFDLLLPIDGRLGAQHAAYAPSPLYAVLARNDPTAAPSTTVLQLSLLGAPSQLQGRVVDAAGQAIVDAELEVRSALPPPNGAALPAPPQVVRSDRDGTFAVSHLRPGRVEFRARAAGHGPCRGAVDLAPGEARAIEVVLAPACEVHGRIEDEAGAPVSDCRVWSGAIEDFDGAFAVTGRDGTFQLRDLPPGPIRLTAREGAGVAADPLVRRAEGTVELRPGQVGHWVGQLRQPAVAGFLRGQVVDQDGAPLPTWRVTLRHRSSGAQQGKTDSGGFFHVRLPGPGPIDVFVHAPNAPPQSFAHAVLHGVTADSGPLRVVVDRRQARSSCTGRVQSVELQPLAATLTCWHHERQELARFQADASGTIRLESVPPGTIDLHVEHPGHALLSRSGIAVGANTIVDLGTLVLEVAATLYGEVTGPDGQPPGELLVTLSTPTQRLTAEYTAGTYRFAAAPPGRHLLQVQGPTVAAAHWHVELNPGRERRQDMRLEAGVPRSIAVQAARAAGLMVSVAIRRQADAAPTWLGRAPLRAAGGTTTAEFVACMAPGVYEVIAWDEFGGEARTEVQFVPGDDTTVRLYLAQ